MATIKTKPLLSYHSHDDVDSDYWRELGTTIDQINDISANEIIIDLRLETLIYKMTLEHLKELAKEYGIEIEKDASKEHIYSSFKILEINQKIELLLLHDFLNRKKRAIDEIYTLKGKSTKNLQASLARLKHLFVQSPKRLMEAYTYFLWNEKGSGTVYTLSTKIKFKELIKLTTEYRNSFVDELYKKTGKNNHYKVYSYMELQGESLIINIHKQIGDTPKPDFDGAIRNKEVSSILLKIDIENSLIEIKGANKTDETAITSYLEETYSLNASYVKRDVFKNYDPAAITEAFSTGNAVKKSPKLDFLITKISFRSSLLKRSPKLSFELDNESIWSSVMDASGYGILKIRSIKDVESLTAKVKNKKRIIRSNILQNGNVIFSFDDSRMEKDIRESFIDNFYNLFGIPMFQEVSNQFYVEGKADKLDYVMSLSNASILEEGDREVFKELIDKKLILEEKSLILTCKGCKDVTEKEDIDYDISSFTCECGESKCTHKSKSILKIDLKKASRFIKTKIGSILKEVGYTDKPSISTISINESKHEFISYHNNNEIVQLFITSDYIRPSFVKRLSTMMIPTIIITLGMSEEKIQSLNDQGLFPINFGKIYYLKGNDLKEELLEVIQRIKLQSKTKVSEAADHAYMSLKMIPEEPEEIKESYNDKIFEDDVFALLKDIIPNAEKWGKEKSGKAYPEGIFAISSKNVNKPNSTMIKRVFSYDCKLTRSDDGYNLGRDQKRQAFEYVEKLNDNDYVSSFSSKNELTAHIFICNKFQEKQKEGMRDYFNEALGEEYNTIPCFIDLESLLYLHECYRENVEHLHANRNLFYEKLILLFKKEIINKKEIDKIFEKALDKDLKENEILDTKKVTKTFKEY
ncbi:hypothetical protein PDQ74_20890 [Bacillus cereus group sp. Bc005]|uniref:hypothetical protein n=1 Tax=unclassified Bacillus cereus group TaxID=2750818 RepID=UPI0022E82FF1|nr:MULTISPECIES: hypothetical protein [unclassified Bacillus cereus group]MDA1508010.1 hypothetical protein [Bacillus cereus group sp. TH36-2LC]MDA2759425.1 hypothetical protein [Bacillus cereus group sp. Bc007]MDA2765053.1 hypothetical protein [Bacillus cereus group sp. Bc008]MDA2776184.1 hypothetical protein [Bacillus cereus group sp. Bc005]